MIEVIIIKYININLLEVITPANWNVIASFQPKGFKNRDILK